MEAKVNGKVTVKAALLAWMSAAISTNGTNSITFETRLTEMETQLVNSCEYDSKFPEGLNQRDQVFCQTTVLSCTTIGRLTSNCLFQLNTKALSKRFRAFQSFMDRNVNFNDVLLAHMI